MTLALEPRDAWAYRFVREIPALNSVIGGEAGLRRALAQRTDHVLLWRDRRLHVEEFRNGVSAPIVVFHHGYGAYSALYSPFLAALSSRGARVLAIDRPGHGLSEGRRGDCTVAELAEATRHVLQTLLGLSRRPVVVFGSSAGGMLTSCLIPHLDAIVDAYICHGVHNPAHSIRGLAPALRTVADLVPGARFPYRLIPRQVRVGISDEPVVRDWFRPGSDDLATFDQTLRSVLSMSATYAPPRPLHEVDRPVLVVAGSADRMLPLQRVRASLGRMALRRPTLEVIDGAHMLLHERPEEVIDVVAGWISDLKRSGSAR